jgi:hypothetical protein
LLEQGAMSMARRQDSVFRAFAVLAALAVAGAAGCGRQSSEQAVDEALRMAGQSRKTVFPLAGKVTIDGHAPGKTDPLAPRITVMLFDQAKLDAPLDTVPRTNCKANGEFAFSSYGQGDGVPAGKYVVTIVELKFDKRKGHTEPDELKNLYNDPEKNAQIPEFKIDHQSPGKTNYDFDLQIAGHEQATPGPHSVVRYR